MQESILVGVTDSSASHRAVDWASHRARERSSRIEMISVVGGAVGTVGEGAIIDDAVARTQALLDREAERARAYGVPVETRIDRGDPVRKLIDASMVFDLLVIGSDYRGASDGPRRGPHGIRIVAGAHCPVAVVPDIDLTGRRGIVVGVDDSPSSERAVDFAAAEADRLREPLTAVTTWSPVPVPFDMHAYPEEYLSAMQKLSEETLAISLAGLRRDYPDVVVTPVIERGRPETTINRLAAEARLAVIGSNGKGAIARFLLGSTSREVLARMATATVVIR